MVHHTTQIVVHIMNSHYKIPRLAFNLFIVGTSSLYNAYCLLATLTIKFKMALIVSAAWGGGGWGKLL